MKRYSEENLNALLDGEYSTAQQVQMLSDLQEDGEATGELCRLRNVKQLVTSAYQDVPGQPARPPCRRRSFRPLATAASLLFVAAASLLLAGAWGERWPGGAERLAVLDPDGRGQRPALATDDEMRIVLHLLTPDMQVAGELLDEVEMLLAEHRSGGRPLRVEIVAHSEGLAFLREGLSAHGERVARLAAEYPNLAFVACLNTVERLRVEQGVEVALLPEVQTTQSGVAHVVERQREGWAYVKV